MNRKNEVFLVTGGAGLLGSYLVGLLAKEMPGSQIIVVDRAQSRIRFKVSRKIKVITGNLESVKTWEKIPQNISTVFHLAAFIPRNDKDRESPDTAARNLLPLERLVEYSRNWKNLKQVIYSSSVAVYAKTASLLKENYLKEPLDIYGLSKLAGELMLGCMESQEIRVAFLRYSSLYGYGQFQGTVLPIMINCALKNNKIIVYGEGTRVQDFLHYSDAAMANILAFKNMAEGAFNIGSGKFVTMLELAKTISKVFTNGKAKIVHIPKDDDYDPGIKLDIRKAARYFGYRPSIFLQDGLRMLKKEMGVK
jgi:nucleoside-diphosphate-sugar epimerase